MYKLLACIAVFVGSSAIGHLFARNLEKRTLALQNMEAAITILRSRMRYYVEPVMTTFMRVGKTVQGEMGDMLCLTAERMCAGVNCRQAMEQAFAECRGKHGNLAALSQDDMCIFLELADRIGLDLYAQAAAFDFALSRLHLLSDDAKTKKTQLARLYRTSGMLVGALLTVIFI